jgi:hypothetical protein
MNINFHEVFETQGKYLGKKKYSSNVAYNFLLVSEFWFVSFNSLEASEKLNI